MIFLINFISAMVIKAKWDSNSVDIYAIYTGDCSKPERISTGIRLAI